MTQQQREGIREAPYHVFVVEDGDTADEMRTFLEQQGCEVSLVESEPEENDAVQRISAAVPEATVVAVQAAAQADESTSSTSSRPDAPRTRADLKGTYSDVVGESPQVLAMLQDIAQALHNHSDRWNEKLVVVNCGAIDSSLMRGALFGHEKGSFTDAHQQHIGYFEQADGGTLFLDEIGEVPLEAQPNFLRVIETGRFHRIGGTEEISVNVRVIAATNRDLPWEVQEKLFREDLYERLKTLTISVPSLRERPGDIPALAQHFLEKESQAHNLQVGEFSPAALALLKTYAWPRNIRQLKNAVITAIVNAEGDIILPVHLSAELQYSPPPHEAVAEEPLQAEASYVVNFPLTTTLEETMAAVEKACILNTLARCKDNRTYAAQALGMELRTFNRRLVRHRLLQRDYA